MDNKSSWTKIVKATMEKKGRKYKDFSVAIGGDRHEIWGFDCVQFKEPDAVVDDDEFDE